MGIVRPSGVPLQDYEEVKVAHWAVIVAKVPIKEQLKLFRDAFENARGYNPAADFPQYLGYYVQRAEIKPGEEEKDLQWEPVKVYDGKSSRPIGPLVSSTVLYGSAAELAANPNAKSKPGVVTDWVSQMPEVVDPRYLEGGVLAFPLPPLVGRDWGAEVTHSEIPLAVDAVPEEEEADKTEPAKPEATEEAEPGDLFAGSNANAGMGERQPMMGGMRGYGGMGRGGAMEEYGGGRGYGGYEMGGRGMGGYGMGRGMGSYGEGGGYAAGGRSGLGQDGEPQAPHWLLRFFDFSVQPGKKYRYRVQLAMLDPNGAVPTESLDSTAIARIRKDKAARRPGRTPYRLTEWSKASAPVSIPLAGSVHVASTKPATDGFNKEPSVRLLVESFGTDEKGNAIQVAEEADFDRGNVANMTKDTKKIVEQGRAYDPVSDFKFRTGITVIDMQGGERMTRDMQRPGRVLLMGSAGQLFVQTEMNDADVVETHKLTFAEEPTGGAGGGFPRGGPGYGREGGYEGGRGR
jgi:hypothetical protein